MLDMPININKGNNMNIKNILKDILKPFKEGVYDALINGVNNQNYPDRYWYRLGYDFGMTLYEEKNKGE